MPSPLETQQAGARLLRKSGKDRHPWGGSDFHPRRPTDSLPDPLNTLDVFHTVQEFVDRAVIPVGQRIQTAVRKIDDRVQVASERIGLRANTILSMLQDPRQFATVAADIGARDTLRLAAQQHHRAILDHRQQLLDRTVSMMLGGGTFGPTRLRQGGRVNSITLHPRNRRARWQLFGLSVPIVGTVLASCMNPSQAAPPPDSSPTPGPKGPAFLCPPGDASGQSVVTFDTLNAGHDRQVIFDQLNTVDGQFNAKIQSAVNAAVTSGKFASDTVIGCLPTMWDGYSDTKDGQGISPFIAQSTISHPDRVTYYAVQGDALIDPHADSVITGSKWLKDFDAHPLSLGRLTEGKLNVFAYTKPGSDQISALYDLATGKVYTGQEMVDRFGSSLSEIPFLMNSSASKLLNDASQLFGGGNFSLRYEALNTDNGPVFRPTILDGSGKSIAFVDLHGTLQKIPEVLPTATVPPQVEPLDTDYPLSDQIPQHVTARGGSLPPELVGNGSIPPSQVWLEDMVNVSDGLYGGQHVIVTYDGQTIDPGQISPSTVVIDTAVNTYKMGTDFRYSIIAKLKDTGQFLWMRSKDGVFSDKPLIDPGAGSELVVLPAPASGHTQQLEWVEGTEWPVLTERDGQGNLVWYFKQAVRPGVEDPTLAGKFIGPDGMPISQNAATPEPNEIPVFTDVLFQDAFDSGTIARGFGGEWWNWNNVHQYGGVVDIKNVEDVLPDSKDWVDANGNNRGNVLVSKVTGEPELLPEWGPGYWRALYPDYMVQGRDGINRYLPGTVGSIKSDIWTSSDIGSTSLLSVHRLNISKGYADSVVALGIKDGTIPLLYVLDVDGQTRQVPLNSKLLNPGWNTWEIVINEQGQVLPIINGQLAMSMKRVFTVPIDKDHPGTFSDGHSGINGSSQDKDQELIGKNAFVVNDNFEIRFK